MFTLLIIATCHTTALAEQPSWTKENGQVRQGDRFLATCHAKSVSLDLARQNAVASCDALAGRQVGQMNISTLSVETEGSVGFHQEIKHEVSGNFHCKPLKESVDASMEDEVSLWIRCEYDLGKVASVQQASPKATIDSRPTSGASASDLTNVKDKGGFDQSSARVFSGERRTINLISVPQCDSILITGATARKIDCTKNPLPIMLNPATDTEIVVRSKGFVPKHVPLSSIKQDDEDLYVTLETSP